MNTGALNNQWLQNKAAGTSALSIDTLAGKTEGAQSTQAAQGPTASGNIGLGKTPSAFDTAWNNNTVIREDKPRIPTFALQLAGNTELVRQVNTLLYASKADPLDIQSIMDLLSSKILELSIDGEAQTLKDRQTKMEANQKDREKLLEVAQAKAAKANNVGDWDKIFGVVKAVVSVVASLAIMAAGAMLLATGAGALVGGVMIAYGAYMLANSVLDVVNAVRATQGKDPLDLKLNLGSVMADLAKSMGASEETQMWVNLGTEVVLGVIVIIVTAGAGSGTAASNVASAAAKYADVAKAAKFVGQAANITGGVTGIAKGVLTINLAITKKEQADIKAQQDRLQTLYNQLSAQIKNSADFMTTLQEALMSIWDTAAARLQTTNEARLRALGGGGRSMV
jgi:hypothetical protein